MKNLRLLHFVFLVAVTSLNNISYAQNRIGNANENIISEDIELTKYNDLRLKDRRATKNNLGYVYQQLDSDFVNQWEESNTIYEIRYKVDLKQKTIALPDNVTL